MFIDNDDPTFMAILVSSDASIGAVRQICELYRMYFDFGFHKRRAFFSLHKGPDWKSGLHQNLGAAHLLASTIAMVLAEPTNQTLSRELIRPGRDGTLLRRNRIDRNPFPHGVSLDICGNNAGWENQSPVRAITTINDDVAAQTN
jgi:hypothetical protein